MTKDFTLQSYKALLSALQEAGYCFLPFRDYNRDDDSRTIFLRHDVDLRPDRSLATAQLEHSMGIRAVYYFRAVPESWDEDIIRDIASLGHEVGYHYESLTTCHGDVDAAYNDFTKNLTRLRTLVDVTTICMHGSPRSPYDSKDIWKKYDYHHLGIIAEPYLDTDFSSCFYLTDTGRRWDGYKVSVRDKVPQQEEWNSMGLTFHTTEDIIKAAASLPSRIMITTHPQRWTDSSWGWTKELLMQNAKNIIKKIIINNGTK